MKISSSENLFIRDGRGAPPIPMERLQKWEYSESSSSIVAMASSGQLLLVTVSLEGKRKSHFQLDTSIQLLLAAASTSVGLHAYPDVLQLASNLVVYTDLTSWHELTHTWLHTMHTIQGITSIFRHTAESTRGLVLHLVCV